MAVDLAGSTYTKEMAEEARIEKEHLRGLHEALGEVGVVGLHEIEHVARAQYREPPLHGGMGYAGLRARRRLIGQSRPGARPSQGSPRGPGYTEAWCKAMMPPARISYLGFTNPAWRMTSRSASGSGKRRTEAGR